MLNAIAELDLHKVVGLRLGPIALMVALLAGSAAAETGATMTRLSTRVVAPKPPEDSLSVVASDVVRVGSTHARLLLIPAKKDAPKQLLITAEPDVWLVDREGHTATHSVDAPEEATVHLPVLPPDPKHVPKELTGLEWGQELAFMEAHHATVKDNTRLMKVERVSVQLDLHPKTKLPARIRIREDERTVLEVEYTAYEVNLPFDATLFRPPEGVTIAEEGAADEGGAEIRKTPSPTSPAALTSFRMLSSEEVLDSSLDRNDAIAFIYRAQMVVCHVLRGVKPPSHTEATVTFVLKRGEPTGVQLKFTPDAVPAERKAQLAATLARLNPSPTLKGKPASFAFKFLLPSAEELAAADKALAAHPPKWGISRPAPEDEAGVTAGLAGWEAGKPDAFGDVLIVGGALWSRITAKAPDAKGIGTRLTIMQNMKERKPEGRTMRKSEEVKALLEVPAIKAIGAEFHKGVVRPATTWERELFYAMIPFEITQEPLTVVEKDGDVLVVQLSHGQVSWLELLVDVPGP